MTYTVERELTRFKNLAQARLGALHIEPICDHGVLITPRRGGVVRAPGKRIALTLQGITHGNETAGLAAVNQLLHQILAGLVDLRIPLALILGNPAAALANRRFIDRDLNRSFRREQASLWEERRARELAAVLTESAYFLDYHQVTRRSDRAFFIFPFQAKNYAFARAIGPRHTIVTHWGKPFSSEGMCTDEYVNSCGGIGISFELGQNGFDPYQIAVGVEAGLEAIRAVTAQLEHGEWGNGRAGLTHEDHGELYTWADIAPWPEGAYVELRPDWQNFAFVQARDQIGFVDGQPLLAATAGRMLFPKYLTRDEQAALTSRPTELYRLLRAIGEGELPQR